MAAPPQDSHVAVLDILLHLYFSARSAPDYSIFQKTINPLTANDELFRHENLTFIRDLDTEAGT